MQIVSSIYYNKFFLMYLVFIGHGASHTIILPWYSHMHSKVIKLYSQLLEVEAKLHLVLFADLRIIPGNIYI